MGHMSVVEMRQFLTEELALEWHLQSNCYPPVHGAFIPMARKAIEHARAGEWNHLLEFPEGAGRHGQTEPVQWVIEKLHLQAFLEGDNNDEI